MQESDRLKILEAFPFIEKIDAQSREKLFETGTIRTFPKDQQIMNEGMSCPFISFVLHGTVRVYKLSPDGKEITLYRMTKGDTCVMTASCILSNKEYPALALTEEEISVFVIPSTLFHKMMDTSLIWREYIFNLFSERLAEVIMLVEEVAFKSMNKRLSEFILQKANENMLSATHEEIAFELGTAREVVSRLLKEFERKGYITLSRGKILIMDQDMLRKASNL